MLNFTDYVEIQSELQNHCERYPSQDELIMAILAELGEFAQSRKGEWCWWKRNGQGFSSEDRERQLDELADIMCFLLVGYLMENDKGEPSRSNPWESLSGISTHEYVNAIFFAIMMGAFDRAFGALMLWATHLGYSREEIEQAYLKKVEVNKSRW
jgi:dimeric dUTPase (all-alpha-NTP-PPase superfamily)